MYWVPFRYTVALQALTLKWLRDGGHETVKPAKMRNDSVDIIYVTLGTLFDGVLPSSRRGGYRPTRPLGVRTLPGNGHIGG